MEVISGSTAVSTSIEPYRSEPRVAPVPAEVTIPNGLERKRMASLSDSELVGESSAGSLAAFDELVTRYRGKILRLVHSVLGQHTDAEDIVQDIFVKIYLSLDRFRGDASFSTYLYTVTVNRCRDELRRSKLRRLFSLDEWLSGNSNAHPAHENRQSLDDDENRRAVQAAMKRLPSQTQMLLYLREVEELSYKELADIFEVEIGTIKSRLARSRDRLREELLPYFRDGKMPGDSGRSRK